MIIIWRDNFAVFLISWVRSKNIFIFYDIWRTGFVYILRQIWKMVLLFFHFYQMIYGYKNSTDMLEKIFTLFHTIRSTRFHTKRRKKKGKWNKEQIERNFLLFPNPRHLFLSLHYPRKKEKKKNERPSPPQKKRKKKRLKKNKWHFRYSKIEVLTSAARHSRKVFPSRRLSRKAVMAWKSRVMKLSVRSPGSLMNLGS